MTLRNIVKALREQGHRVTYRVRQDGSIRVTSIDGRKFSPRFSTGNAEARNLLGVQLSERRTRQLQKGRAIVKKKKAKKAPLPPQIKKALRRTQRIIRNRAKTTATVSAENVRYNIEHYGEEEALNKLRRTERYYRGYAYEENVRMLADRMRQDGYKLGSQHLVNLAERIWNNRETFREEWVARALEILYDLETESSGANAQQISELVARAINKLLSVFGW